METTTEITDFGTNIYDTSEEAIECQYYDYYKYFDCESTLWERHLGRNLIRYLSLIIVILGTSGNIMSLIVFSTKSMSGSVSSIFFRILAIVDTIFLFSTLPRYWIIVIFRYDIRNYHDVICKIHPFLVYWSGHLTGWILSAVAIERAVGVSMPHIYKSMVTRKRAKVLLATIILALGGLDSYLLFSRRIIAGYCSTDPDMIEFDHNVWFYLDITAYCFCPFTMICLSNVCIIFFVVRSSIWRKKSLTTNQASASTSSLSTILITVSVVYLACSLPVEIYIPVNNAWRVPGMTWKTYSLLSLYNAFATLLAPVNSAANFYLYCLSGTTFRKALKGLFQ